MTEPKKKGRGRPKGSTNKKKMVRSAPKKKKEPELVKYETIDGKKVCPICKTQKGLECQDCNIKTKKGVDYFISKYACSICNVFMMIETPIKEL